MGKNSGIVKWITECGVPGGLTSQCCGDRLVASTRPSLCAGSSQPGRHQPSGSPMPVGLVARDIFQHNTRCVSPQLCLLPHVSEPQLLRVLVQPRNASSIIMED